MKASQEVVPLAVRPVNLDGLIVREYFEVLVDSNKLQKVEESPKLKIVELEPDSFMFRKLRKPDFQRRTAHWTPAKIAGFIKSFVSGDLIPAVILWQSDTSGDIFVIDGAHRLSALIAWVHDDYGDKKLSLQFSDGRVSREQQEVATETRKLIAEMVGSYVEIKHGTNPPPERSRYSSNLAAGGVTLQWVRGDANTAERSFHTINTEQTPIGDLEVRLIRDRRCPNTIAARALVQAGTGQFYYSTFPAENQKTIRSIAEAIYGDLFVPPLDTPIRTLDLPVAGRSYSEDSLKLILDVVEFVNKKTPSELAAGAAVLAQKRKRKGDTDILSPTMPVDEDGAVTIEFLKNFRKASSRIAGTSPGSLGLHPAVYFYSATGAYQPTAFLAAISFIQDLEALDQFPHFTKYRYSFEELLLKYKYFINQIVRHYGSGSRGLLALTRLYGYLFQGAVDGAEEAALVPTLVEDQRLSFLKPIVDFDKGTKKDFSTERKSAVFLREAIEKALRCSLCNARVHIRSISIDHVQRKREGGRAQDDNGQLAHPYCNSIKN
jgi:hypothetical protein